VKKSLITGLVVIVMAAISMLIVNGCIPKKVDISKPANYVGSEKCKECHVEIYNGWRSTFHPYKFQDVSPEVVVGNFMKNNILTVKGYITRMSRDVDDFFVTTIGPDNKEHTYKIKYVIGSFWKQRYVTEFPSGALHILPVQWNVKTQEWVDYHGLDKYKPGDGKYWSDKQRTYQFKCTGCHNTNSQINYDEATDTFKTIWTEKGIGCEACHGPGSNHIIADIPDKSTTVINPAKIPDPRRAAMVCGSCHTRGNSADGRFEYPAGYKPGGQLNFLFDEKPGVYPDGSPKEHHQQYNDWELGEHAVAGVMCWHCHDPHAKGKANKNQLKLPGSVLCKSCHTVVESKGVHGIHSINNCVGCHMPNTAKSAVKGDIRSHQFKVVSPELTIKEGGDMEKQPNSCNLCHYHKDDKPQEMWNILKKVKAEGKKRV